MSLENALPPTPVSQASLPFREVFKESLSLENALPRHLYRKRPFRPSSEGTRHAQFCSSQCTNPREFIHFSPMKLCDAAWPDAEAHKGRGHRAGTPTYRLCSSHPRVSRAWTNLPPHPVTSLAVQSLLSLPPSNQPLALLSQRAPLLFKAISTSSSLFSPSFSTLRGTIRSPTRSPGLTNSKVPNPT